MAGKGRLLNDWRWCIDALAQTALRCQWGNNTQARQECALLLDKFNGAILRL